MNILDHIPIELDAGDLVKTLRIRRNIPYITEKIASLIEAIRPVMNPKALYTVRYVDEVKGDSIILGDNVFTSKVLRMNLESVGRVFPYIATAGSELDNVSLEKGQSAMLLDQVKNVIVSRAFKYLQSHIEEKYRINSLSAISPGRLDEWPITEQRVLFKLFGDNVARIGVSLTSTCLMVPVKSVSGFFFPSEEGFESCQLCQRENCMGRRAVYDPGLAQKYGVEA